MIRTTLAYVASAAVGLGAAWAARPLPPEPIAFEDTGSPFFPEFSDPSDATRLEVHAWSEAESQVKSFAVAFENGRWVIPTHHGYPADAVERMGKAAGSFVGVLKDRFVTDLEKDHAELGVLSPDALDGDDEARGIRVLLQEASGRSLVDVIVGKAVPGKAGYRYLRRTDSNRVYASKVKVDLSTKFEDWIDRELFELETEEIVALEIHPYRVDETTGRVRGDQPARFELRSPEAEASPAWMEVDLTSNTSVEDGVLASVPAPRGKELDPSIIRAVNRALDQLRIVGVRAQPQPLTPRALESKGFFLSPDLQQLFGNEGHISVTTKDGVVLTLYFGEISHESGLALTAGLEATEASDDASASDTNAHRYVFVSARYDAKRDQREETSKDTSRPRGEARAKLMNERFGKWFYVVGNDAFEQLRKERAEFYKDK